MHEDVLSWEGIAFFTGKHPIEEFGKAITTFLMILNNPLFPWPGGTTLLAWPNACAVWRTEGSSGANQASIEFAHHFPLDSIGREDFALPTRYSPENSTIWNSPQIQVLRNFKKSFWARQKLDRKRASMRSVAAKLGLIKSGV